MAGTIIDMSKIKQLLYLKKAGVSNRQIAKDLKMSRDFAITFFPIQPSHRHRSGLCACNQKVRNSTPQCDHIILRVQVDIFSLNGPPKAFYPNIVKESHSMVHHTTEVEHVTAILKSRAKRKVTDEDASKEDSK